MKRCRLSDQERLTPYLGDTRKLLQIGENKSYPEKGKGEFLCGGGLRNKNNDNPGSIKGREGVNREECLSKS